jgi:Peptidase family S41
MSVSTADHELVSPPHHGDGSPTRRPEYLGATAEPVREALAASLTLNEFLQTVGQLTLAERRILVDQAIVLVRDNYVHLPFKEAMHGVNPGQRLRLLRARLERQTQETMDPELAFHAEMSAIFNSVRDLHTNYMLPIPFVTKIPEDPPRLVSKFAYLPFLIEEYRDETGSRYIVGHVLQGYTAPGLEPGAEITYWNGVPIDRAVEINAARFAGSNPAARLLRGVESLTLRALRVHPAPDEEWVTFSYIGVDGAEYERREPWLVADNRPSFVPDPKELASDAVVIGLDIGADEIGRARQVLFAPQTIAAEHDVETSGAPQAVSAEAGDIPTSLPTVFRARKTPDGMFGHIRIFTFNVNDPAAFVNEFVRLIRLLPQDGLIVDVRGNGGGHIHASEFTLQTLSPRKIEPEPVQFINTELNLRIARKFKDDSQINLGPWLASMEQAVETGEVFSSAFPITPRDRANAIGQQYQGPVVLITNAACYSATDIFAAGFQDHGIGTVLGVDENTGAGGANVWTHALLKDLLDEAPADPGTPYKALPKEAGMRVAIRRTLRVGDRTGTPLEDLGVVPDERYNLTRDDVLHGNVGLLKRAGEILKSKPVRRLAANAAANSGGKLGVYITEARGVDRVDVYVDGRPRATVDVNGSAILEVPGEAGARVRLEGFADGGLVISQTVDAEPAAL